MRETDISMRRAATTETPSRNTEREVDDRLHVPPNAAVQRPRAAVWCAARVHNEVTHMRRARADVSRSAATACYALALH